MLVGSLYNIVDQFFIGQYVGQLGNAATNIAFPFSTSCVAISLLFGIGGASNFNLALGRGKQDRARGYMGTAVALAAVSGLALAVFAEVLLRPVLLFFGSSQAILPYAMDYTRITAIGFPALIMSTVGAHLIRGDGRPQISMVCNMTGAVLNIFLDAWFMISFGWGMKGAALATILGQYISCGLAVWFLAHGKTVRLRPRDLVPRAASARSILALGVAPCINQLAMMVVQIVLNNSLRHYGALSVYGAETAIAVVGIGTKVNMVFMAFVIGMSQSLQPIASFNYGAGKYDRVREAYRRAVTVGAVMAVLSWALFFFFPRQIIGLFGRGENELYYTFAVRYFRIYLFFTLINFMQPITSNFFTALGRARIGAFLSLTRQILFLLPLIVILPVFFGIDGLMFAGPCADLMAAAASAFFVFRLFRELKEREKSTEAG